jgi:hypothetical protein
MDRLEELLEAVHTAAADPDGAYVLRSRVRRLVLACTRGVAEQEGLERPMAPGPFVSRVRDPSSARICRACNLLYSRTESLCQPSEPLDDRWRRGWDDAEAALSELAHAIRSRREEAAAARSS